MRLATDAGRPFSLEYRILRADGGVGCVLERGELVRAGSAIWLAGVIFDLTARKQAEEELRANRARQAADAERARIARELHDSVSQALSPSPCMPGRPSWPWRARVSASTARWPSTSPSCAS